MRSSGLLGAAPFAMQYEEKETLKSSPGDVTEGSSTNVTDRSKSHSVGKITYTSVL